MREEEKRKIGGKIFVKYDAFSNKGVARSHANLLRREGYLARVLPQKLWGKNWWAVYIRHSKKSRYRTIRRGVK